MRANSIFWGLAVIVLGVLLLLSNLNLLPVNIWRLIWPLALVVLGLWFLIAPRLMGGARERQELAVPLEGARRAEVKLTYGAGSLTLGALDVPGQLLSGVFEGGVRESIRRNGDSAFVKLEGVGMPVPGVFVGSHGQIWQVRLSPDVEIQLNLETGASENTLDLTHLRVVDLKVQSGASSTDVMLPVNAGNMRVKVESGAASVTLRVPQGVAVRIKGESFLSGFEIDTARFPRIGDHIYESPDFGTAVNRVEITAEMGVGSVKVL